MPLILLHMVYHPFYLPHTILHHCPPSILFTVHLQQLCSCLRLCFEAIGLMAVHEVDIGEALFAGDANMVGIIYPQLQHGLAKLAGGD